MPHGEHSAEEGRGGVIADATHFSRRCHIDAKYRVCLLQTVKRELRCLDTHIVEVEKILFWTFKWQAQHNLCRQFNEVEFEHLADKWERT